MTTTDIDLIHRCAAHGWALRPDGDGYELLGNGPIAFFSCVDSLVVWLNKQGKQDKPKAHAHPDQLSLFEEATL